MTDTISQKRMLEETHYAAEWFRGNVNDAFIAEQYEINKQYVAKWAAERIRKAILNGVADLVLRHE